MDKERITTIKMLEKHRLVLDILKKLQKVKRKEKTDKLQILFLEDGGFVKAS